MPVEMNGLPPLMTFEDGRPVPTVDDWAERRDEMQAMILALEYGELPGLPFHDCVLLHLHNIAELDNACCYQYRLFCGERREFSFTLTMFVPDGDGPFPVVLTGDGCWRYLTDEVILSCLRERKIVAQFNRVEIAPDNYSSQRDVGVYPVAPGEYGAIAAWARGYHWCVDFLLTHSQVDPERIGIVGHSRGGKAVLLAGATDPRIALTAPNNSGCGGAGSFRCRGPECERIADLVTAVPYWFAPPFQEYRDREETLPFDQHFLKSLVAPRAYLSTEALGDLWANPYGTWVTHQVAKEAYRFLGAEEKAGIVFRPGGHTHGVEDWNVFLEPLTK